MGSINLSEIVGKNYGVKVKTPIYRYKTDKAANVEPVGYLSPGTNINVYSWLQASDGTIFLQYYNSSNQPRLIEWNYKGGADVKLLSDQGIKTNEEKYQLQQTTGQKIESLIMKLFLLGGLFYIGGKYAGK